MIDIQSEQKRVFKVQASFHRMMGIKLQVEDTIIATQTKVSKAKAVVELKDSVDQVLDKAEKDAHARSVGSFEQLLTSLMADSLPRDNQLVKMAVETQRNLPALDIYLEQNGKREDAIGGRGGSVANVLSAGLRFIAIARQQCRKFILLDEADCFLSASHAARFYSVISDLSQKLGIQVVFISHLNTNIQTDFVVHMKRMSNEEGREYTKASFEHFNDDRGVQESGIRWIRLKNFMCFEDQYIPLHKNCTRLTGENDVGKSVITQAFLALAENSASDSCIRHDTSAAIVQVGLENDLILTWERRAKGSPKVIYRLEKNGDTSPIRETPSSTDVPDWVSELLAINTHPELNAQVIGQLKTVFLLDQSKNVRASILSIGRESEYLREMRQIWKSKLTDAGKEVKSGEAELKKLAQYRKVLNQLETIYFDVEQIGESLNNIQRLITKEKVLTYSCQTMQSLTVQSRTLEKAFEIELPSIKVDNPEKLSKAICTIKKLSALTKLNTEFDLPAAPQLPNKSIAEQFIKQMNCNLTLSKANDVSNIPSTPSIPNVGLIKSYLKTKRISNLLSCDLSYVEKPSIRNGNVARLYLEKCTEAENTADLIIAYTNKLEEAKRETSTLLEQIGYCPVCQKTHERGKHV